MRIGNEMVRRLAGQEEADMATRYTDDEVAVLERAARELAAWGKRRPPVSLVDIDRMRAAAQDAERLFNNKEATHAAE